MPKRLALVAVLLSLAGLLPSCRMMDDLPMSPEISKEVRPAAGCVGRHHVLVPNQYLGGDWFANSGSQVDAIDEIATYAGQTDGYYISEHGAFPFDPWVRFGFTNISNPHPNAGVLDLTLRFFAHHHDEPFEITVEVYVNNTLARTGTMYGAGTGERENLSVSFADMGSLASMNTLEVRFYAHEFPVYVHSLNAEIFSFVPTADCPEPTE
jgi:hypothetical protein